VKLAELLAIKSELTLIKVQIDGLLDSVEKMDRRRKDHSGRRVGAWTGEFISYYKLDVSSPE
jgi:hypothetical protein